MNHKNYRESKINKYPDRQTGLLMYKHNKLYDIVNLIDKFINKENRANILNNLPDKYIEKTKGLFENYIILSQSTETKINQLKSDNDIKNFIKEMNINDKKICNSNLGEKIKISSYKGIPLVQINKTNRHEIYSDSYGCSISINNNKDNNTNIILGPKGMNFKTKRHEYQHVLYDYALGEKGKTVINHIKDEILAHIAEKESMQNPEKLIKIIIEVYLKEYLNKKNIDIKYIQKEKKIILKEGKLKKHEMKSLLVLGGVIYDAVMDIFEIYNYTINKYYNHQQLIYLLSFTPLSQRPSLLDYYKKINSLHQIKSDLYSTLSNSNV